MQVCNSDQRIVALMARWRETRCPSPHALCQHGPGSVPAGSDQGVRQSPRVGTFGRGASPLFCHENIHLFSNRCRLQREPSQKVKIYEKNHAPKRLWFASSCHKMATKHDMKRLNSFQHNSLTTRWHQSTIFMADLGLSIKIRNEWLRLTFKHQIKASLEKLFEHLLNIRLKVHVLVRSLSPLVRTRAQLYKLGLTRNFFFCFTPPSFGLLEWTIMPIVNLHHE